MAWPAMELRCTTATRRPPSSVGVDLGYYDSITIASHADLTARLHHLADDYDQRIADYEAKVGALPGIPAFLAAMPDLTGIDA